MLCFTLHWPGFEGGCLWRLSAEAWLHWTIGTGLSVLGPASPWNIAQKLSICGRGWETLCMCWQFDGQPASWCALTVI